MEIISYRVCQILFCARGPSNSPLSCCWAFTTSRPSTVTSSEKTSQETLYQCQVFRCENQDAVSDISSSIFESFPIEIRSIVY